MELPDVGEHCAKKDCNKLDFLPIKCDTCLNIFCDEHYTYKSHHCPKAYTKDNQVPVCPLCNKPIPTAGNHPDVVVSAHIDSDCQSDPAKDRRSKIFTNRCSLKGCKQRELIPFDCPDCGQNHCLEHRHPKDHKCEGKDAIRKRKAADAATKRSKIGVTRTNVNVNYATKVHGNMTEDEALARALALSMQENNQKTQEELDLALARQLQASESQTVVDETRNSRDKCILS